MMEQLFPPSRRVLDFIVPGLLTGDRVEQSAGESVFGNVNTKHDATPLEKEKLATPLRIIGCPAVCLIWSAVCLIWSAVCLIWSAAGFFIGGQVQFASLLWEAVTPEPY
jgi:hypothetical protein